MQAALLFFSDSVILSLLFTLATSRLEKSHFNQRFRILC